MDVGRCEAGLLRYYELSRPIIQGEGFRKGQGGESLVASRYEDHGDKRISFLEDSELGEKGAAHTANA